MVISMDSIEDKTEGTPFFYYNGQNVRKSDFDQQDHCICSPIPFEHTFC
jgi:hypothetical protein